MSEIRADDLVQVVRTSHKCAQRTLWMVFRVKAVGAAAWSCELCGHLEAEPCGFADVDLNGAGFPLTWLRKIEPPSQAVTRTTEAVA